MSRYPAAETANKHKRIWNEASRLFRERGISGVSVGDLMKAADLTHGAFYNHFESKQALVSDCVAHLTGQALERIGGFEPTIDGKRAFVETYLSDSARNDPGLHCLMSSLGPDIGREPAAKRAMTHYVRSFLDKLAFHFPWPKPRQARRDAIRMTTALVGALVLARAVDDEALSEEILRETIDQFC